MAMMIKEVESQKEQIRKGVNAGELKLNQRITVSQEFEILEKLTKKAAALKKDSCLENQVKNEGDKSPTSLLKKESTINSFQRKIKPNRNSLYISPASMNNNPSTPQNNKDSGLRNQANERKDEVLQTQNKRNSIVSRLVQEKSNIKVYDKFSLNKIQRELIEQRQIQQTGNQSLPYIDSRALKKKTIQYLDKESTVSTEIKSPIDYFFEKKMTVISPTKSPMSNTSFGKLINFMKEEETSPSKKTAPSTGNLGVSPTILGSPSPMAIHSLFGSPILSPAAKLPTNNFFSSSSRKLIIPNLQSNK